MKNELLIVYTASAFMVTFLFMPVLIKLLSQWQIFDSPGKHKIHRHYVPSMGGICILLGVGFSLLIGMPFSQWTELKFFFIPLAMMFVTGLRDDILTLTPLEKLIGQLLPIIIMVVFGTTMITSFYGMALTGFTFPTYVSWFITIFTVIILTNAYNLIDGLDGLAGSVGLISLVCFGSWFALYDRQSVALVCFAFAGAIAAFLVYNWQPSKIFMGDTGALVIGLLLSYVTLEFINVNHALAPTDPLKFNSSVGTAVCVMIIPVFDTLRVIILRLRKLQSPFKADKNHLHHQFLKLGFSHAKSVAILVTIQLAFIAFAFAFRSAGDMVILPLAAAGCLAISIGLKVALRNYERHGGNSLITEK